VAKRGAAGDKRSKALVSVVIYSTRYCGYCAQARDLLAHKGVAFEEVMVDQDPERRDEMMQRSGQRSVPQVFVDDRYIGGYDALHALERSGELDDLLKRNG
jgi:glutaredoxin 3